MNIMSFLIPTLVGLVFGILGYLLGRISSKKDVLLAISLQEDLDVCKATVKNLNQKINSLDTELAAKTKNYNSQIQPQVIFDKEIALTILGKKVRNNDLKIVEGIGVKIESLFNEAGITSWQELSITSTEKLQSILDAGGENYGIHNPSTWAKQALMAYQGKWQELKDWQANLLGGKE
ncbi:hypothetical protein [Flavobacterium sp. KACC 22761]|uniref:hypothetical protein n=1 Tax=Flavobacterium sp. KACC 22761 TaxID=3092665 RepID=UPI002A75CAF6|nr:hypothetical protein [Flavobacterium sp. KACC 22761]WPO78094.1 hypothetical protein SCB73_17640 [Flavobacterium sp. KACC 22761]